MALETPEQQATRLAILRRLRRTYFTAVAVTALGVVGSIITVALDDGVERFASVHRDWGWLVRILVGGVPPVVMGLGVSAVAILWFLTQQFAIPGVPDRLPIKWRWRFWSLAASLLIVCAVLMILVV